MDREIVAELKRQRLEKVDQVCKEMAWEEEKCRISLEKVQSRYHGVCHMLPNSKRSYRAT